MIPPNPYNDRISRDAPRLTDAEVVIFVPEYNSPGKRDATGAFHPGAADFCEFYKLDPKKVIHKIDNTASKTFRAKQLLSRMSNARTLWEETEDYLYPQVYVFFCHGFKAGIQLGIYSPTPGYILTRDDRQHWIEFVTLLGRHPAPVVVLYACSTGDDPDDDSDSAPGSGDNGFGDLLRDNLCVRGCTYNRVVTHSTAGHTFYNPNIRIMDGLGSPLGGHGGVDVAKPGTAVFSKLNRHLKVRKGMPGYGFVWRFPFMSIADMHTELSR